MIDDVQREKPVDPLEELRHLATTMLERIVALQAAPVPAPQLVKLERAAEILAVSRTTVQELIDRGTLPVVELSGRAIRVDVRDIEAFIKATRRRR